LTADADGQLRLEPGGTVVDWLVKMRRLPAEQMLNCMIRAGLMRADDVRNVVGTLCRFYRGCAPAAMGQREYRERFAASIAENLLELSTREFALPIAMIEQTCARQRSFLERAAALFDERAPWRGMDEVAHLRDLHRIVR
jgi:aminoglycoside phosphotransferase family enzyme